MPESEAIQTDKPYRVRKHDTLINVWVYDLIEGNKVKSTSKRTYGTSESATRGAKKALGIRTR